MEERYGIRINLVRSFLEYESDFVEAGGNTVTPIHLDTAALENIYYNNFIRINGADPRRINLNCALRECETLLAEPLLAGNVLAIENIRTIQEEFSGIL